MVEVTTATEAFDVTGDKPFAVASIMLGATFQDPSGGGDNSLGDPAMTMLVTPQQFRQTYTFLAPTDYVENYADVFLPDGTTVKVDGAAIGGTPTSIGGGGYSVVRVKLGEGNGGVLRLAEGFLGGNGSAGGIGAAGGKGKEQQSVEELRVA